MGINHLCSECLMKGCPRRMYMKIRFVMLMLLGILATSIPQVTFLS